jgi:hypothetical protein
MDEGKHDTYVYEYYCFLKKTGNPAICNTMNETGEHYEEK